jgi:hypothetical protein
MDKPAPPFVLLTIRILSFSILIFPVASGAASNTMKQSAARGLAWTSLMDTAAWRLANGYQSCKKWTLADSILDGTDSWIGCDLLLGDFVFEGEFLYNGQSSGSIMVRGDRDAWFPWLSGYAMDIDAGEPGEGMASFPYRPQPCPGQARVRAGAWQRFSIRAVGSAISITINGRDTIGFKDDQFKYGRICLQGDKGGVRFRRLRVLSLDKVVPAGPRTPWIELFDGITTANWSTTGSVTVGRGSMTIDGTKGLAAAVLTLDTIVNGTIEADVWCKRSATSSAPYRFSFRSRGDSAAACFTCRSNCILSCNSGQCGSQFPMFMETTSPEFWRFVLRGTTAEAYRFGDKVMACANVSTTAGAVTIAADSCLLLVRGVRYRGQASLAAAPRRR